MTGDGSLSYFHKTENRPLSYFHVNSNIKKTVPIDITVGTVFIICFTSPALWF